MSGQVLLIRPSGLSPTPIPLYSIVLTWRSITDYNANGAELIVSESIALALAREFLQENASTQDRQSYSPGDEGAEDVVG